MNNEDSFFDQLRKQQIADTELNSNRAQTDQLQAIAPAVLSNADTETQANTVERGGMPPDARRALVSLLRHGVILAAQKFKLFNVICLYESDIRRHLSDMYLNLVLDKKAGICFVASVDEDDDGHDDEDPVSLITRRPLSLYDTLLLLVLRKHYQERETSGEQKVVIDIERIEAQLNPFLPLTNNAKGDRRKLAASLKKMLEKKVIALMRGSQDRFEITPLIRYVVNAQFLETMLAEYQRLTQEAGLNPEQPRDNAEYTNTEDE